MVYAFRTQIDGREYLFIKGCLFVPLSPLISPRQYIFIKVF